MQPSAAHFLRYRTLVRNLVFKDLKLPREVAREPVGRTMAVAPAAMKMMPPAGSPS